jgi:hypothetical protein
MYNMVQVGMLDEQRYQQLKEEPIEISFGETAE